MKKITTIFLCLSLLICTKVFAQPIPNNYTWTGHNTFDATGTLKINRGSDVTGDIYYRMANGTINRLGIGTPGQVLTVSAGLPAWLTGGGGGGGGIDTTAWHVTGNSGTTVGTNFIGTTDNTGLMFKTNSVQSGYIDLVNSNTSFGESSLKNSTSSIANVAFGYRAMDSTTVGNFNTAFGYESLRLNESGNYNTGVGIFSLYRNLSSSNTGVGWGSLFMNSSGQNNTAIGGSSLGSNVSGNGNSAIGYFADVATDSSSYSISLGYLATANSNQLALSDSIHTIKAGGLPTGTGYVLTDVSGNGTLSLQPPSGGSSTNIYNSDGTLNGDRTVDGGGHVLSFDNVSLFQVGGVTPGGAMEANVTGNMTLSAGGTLGFDGAEVRTTSTDSTFFYGNAGTTIGGTTGTLRIYQIPTVYYTIPTSQGSIGQVLKMTGTHTATWQNDSTGGSGTVTSFSAGTLSPLFTTSVATSTTTPALSFALTNASAGTLFGRAIGAGTGAPSYLTPTTFGFKSMAFADSVSFHGNTNITTLGTVTTGVWSGMAIDTAKTKDVSKIIAGTDITTSVSGKAVTVNADTSNGNAKLATQGYVLRNASQWTTGTNQIYYKGRVGINDSIGLPQDIFEVGTNGKYILVDTVSPLVLITAPSGAVEITDNNGSLVNVDAHGVILRYGGTNAGLFVGSTTSGTAGDHVSVTPYPTDSDDVVPLKAIGSISGYLEYTVLLDQGGGGAPTATVLFDNLSATVGGITLVRDASGQYYAQRGDATNWNLAKTSVTIGSPTDHGTTTLNAVDAKAFLVYGGSDKIIITTSQTGISIGIINITGVDGWLTSTAFTIRVYN